MQIQKEKRWKSWRTRNQYGSLFSKKQKKNTEKIEQKTKDIVLKIKINNFDLDFQIDTGSEVMLKLRNFWEGIGNPTLRKSSLLLHQFDGSVIKTLG